MGIPVCGLDLSGNRKEESFGSGGGIAVSVIVPFYNVALWLEGCPTGLERQTLNNIEVILVNDDSWAIVQRYAKNSILYSGQP